jgi:DNA-3-methyladenine glycosylase I
VADLSLPGNAPDTNAAKTGEPDTDLAHVNVAATDPAGSRRAARPGPDGLLRCPWALGAPEYLAYHDQEWGRPVRDDIGIFERLSLEAFQSGLSWLTILRKREGFRAAFAGFDPAVVAGFSPADEARLLADPRIVRNRAKVRAVIQNARAALEVPGGLAALVWGFAGGPDAAPTTLADVPASTSRSQQCARELRHHGFTFVGPVTVYAAFQACGLVNDHLAACCCRSLR